MKVILTLLVFFILFATHAQQDQLTTQFWNNYAHINPATSGLEYKHHAAATYREQWTNVYGAPVTVFANYNIRIGEHHGLGVNYLHSIIGSYKGNDVNVNYNYQVHFDTNRVHTLSFGIALGLAHSDFEGAWIFPGAIEPMPDPVSINPNLNLGIAYKIADFFAGIGVTHLTEAAFTNSYFTPARHFYLMGSYNFHLSKSFNLKPQFQLQTDFVKISANVNLMAAIHEKFWFGFGYRSSDAFIGMLGYDIEKKVRIGYSYDYTINKLSSTSRGSHEIVLGLLIK